jgi:hypothetical protein
LPRFHTRNLVAFDADTYQELPNHFRAAFRKYGRASFRTRIVTISDDENSRLAVLTQPRHSAIQRVSPFCAKVDTVWSEQQRLFEKNRLVHRRGTWSLSLAFRTHLSELWVVGLLLAVPGEQRSTRNSCLLERLAGHRRLGVFCSRCASEANFPNTNRCQ